MERTDDDPTATLKSWTTMELIEWLCWNDSNGIYNDEDSLRELGEILNKEKAIGIIIGQINQR